MPTLLPSSPIHAGEFVSLKRLVCVNAVVAGIEIAASVTFTFIPPLLLKSGFSETAMSIIYGIGPFIALYTVPILGRHSDSCMSAWGRRRPYIFLLSLILIFSLLMLLIGPHLDFLPGTKMAVLAIGVILLDFSSEAAINPCEALMSDIMSAAKNENTGFLVYSAMLSLGSCVGYFMSALDWDDVNNYISEGQSLFALVLLTFTGLLTITMITAGEKPLRPEPMEEIVIDEKGAPICSSPTDMGYISGNDDEPLLISTERYGVFVWAIRHIVHKMHLSFGTICRPIAFVKRIANVILQVILVPFRVFNPVLKAPKILQDLFWADLLSWMGIMSHNMFCTDYVAQVVYGGHPEAEEGSEAESLFDEGVRMGSRGLLLHSIMAFFFSLFLQDRLIGMIGLRGTYILGLVIFSLSMVFTVLASTNVTILNICALFSGLGFSVITTIPNSLITMYHAEPEVYLRRGRKTGFGSDIAILDSGYFLSQIILSIFMGSLVDYTGLPQLYIIVAAVCGFAASFLSMRVVFSKDDLRTTIPHLL